MMVLAKSNKINTAVLCLLIMKETIKLHTMMAATSFMFWGVMENIIVLSDQVYDVSSQA